MFSMTAYIGLFFAVGMTALIESTHAYSKHHKDWCGYRIWPALFLQMALPTVLITLTYFEALHFGAETPFLKDHIVWILAGIGFLAHYLPHRIFGKQWTIILDRPFTMKRLELATSLVELPSCRTILNLSIIDSDLSEREVQALQVECSNDPLTEQQVLHIIKLIGTSRVCSAYEVYTRRHR